MDQTTIHPISPPSNGPEETIDQNEKAVPQKHHVLLFYKYHPLSKERHIVELYRLALERLCQSLNLRGRILVGCNPDHQSEGINGTLSGSNKSQVQAFVQALCHPPTSDSFPVSSEERSAIEEEQEQVAVLQTFWRDASAFYQHAQVSPLVMDESEFKWSTCVMDDSENQSSSKTATTIMSDSSSGLFPDLNIKIVKELIGTGGVLASIPLSETAKGYLTPAEWHERLKEYSEQGTNSTSSAASTNSNSNNNNDTILIDCRNTKEFQIGHFPNALDPKTTTFGQFPTWVNQHAHSLANKSVLMYCTGGIRCEKASAYIRRQVPNVKEVLHLKGGIHKYLDEFGDGPTTGSLWQGKNFVFDGRGAATAPATSAATGSNSATATTNDSNTGQSHETSDKGVVASGVATPTSILIVGKCLYCASPYDTFDPRCVCTVCREPTLVCTTCRSHLGEYHCEAHFGLRNCYFTDLSRFTQAELQGQVNELEAMTQDIAVGKRYKQRRKTLNKQCDKIRQYMSESKIPMEMDSNAGVLNTDKSATQHELKCRNCGDVGCSGRCWGFHGLKRKHILEEQRHGAKRSTETNRNGSSLDSAILSNYKDNNNKNQNCNLRDAKDSKRQQVIQELIQLELSQPAAAHWDATTGIRVPPPCTRVVETRTKGKWCGKSVLHVIQQEFAELARPDFLSLVLRHGLLRVQRGQNLIVIKTMEQAESILLKNMDTLSRIVHWHEPPVYIHRGSIAVEKVLVPDTVIAEHDMGAEDDAVVYVCNKPSSVPVHPAGPYLSNTLTLMVEGQLGLTPMSLIPCHRIDRVTSGLTLCGTNVKVVRQIQRAIECGAVQKLYLAKVHGRFPANRTGADTQLGLILNSSDIAKWEWSPSNSDDDIESQGLVRVDAPIETTDPANGIRAISAKGKTAQSLFRLVAYDPVRDESILSCSPLTGRSHQLRVHLQWLGFSIVNDVQYGGIEEKTVGDDGVRRLVESTKHAACCKKQLSVSDSDAAASCEACWCRQQSGTAGAVASFTEAQLLQTGYSIFLHAIRYRVPIFPRKSKKKGTDTEHKEEAIDTLDLNVGPPDWCNLEASQIAWLA